MCGKLGIYFFKRFNVSQNNNGNSAHIPSWIVSGNASAVYH
ncbi:hypothetical protein CSC17_0811 [Klebsiella oxytoca]|nr:hypothetical protein CSC17_0811 [Klebsiella oxytoca]